MKTARARIAEIGLDGSARIDCPPGLIPKPGQYLLAHADASDSPLPVSVFPAESTPGGFRCAPPIPFTWKPGDLLSLRGPLGHGFTLPETSRKTALVAFDDSPARLQGLILIALRQNAEVVLVSDAGAADLPEIVEVQPLNAMLEILDWADYAALDVDRGNLRRLREMLGKGGQAWMKCEAQVLLRAPMPCGALAECGVCAVVLGREWRMTCKDGPVFGWRDLQ